MVNSKDATTFAKREINCFKLFKLHISPFILQYFMSEYYLNNYLNNLCVHNLAYTINFFQKWIIHGIKSNVHGINFYRMCSFLFYRIPVFGGFATWRIAN